MADLTRKTANLVDQNVFATTYTNYVTSANGIITFNSVASTMSSDGVTVDIPANTVFTCIPLEVTNGILSFRIRFEGETEQDRQMVYLYDSNGEPNTIAPVTLSFAVKKITIFWSNASEKTAAFKNFMVNAGSEPLPYEPYGWVHSLRKQCSATETIQSGDTIYANGQPISTYSIKGNTVQSGTPTPSNPVSVNGVGERTENLWDNLGFSASAINTAGTHITSNNYGTTLSTTTGGIVEITQSNAGDGTNKYQNGFFCIEIDFSQFSVGDNFVISFDYEIVEKHNTQNYTIAYIGQGTSSVNVSGDWGASGRAIIKTAFNSTMTKPYVEIRLCGNSIKVKNVQVNRGTDSLPYEPYGIKIPILTSQGSAVNYLGSVNSRRLVKQIVLTGTETEDTLKMQSTNIFYIKINSTVSLDNANCICTHYVNNQVVNVQLNNGEIKQDRTSLWGDTSGVIVIKDTSISTLEGFKSFLAAQYAAGTPVTIWYVISLPETGQINEPLMAIGTFYDSISNAVSIPTTDGANTITVDATVQPSEFSATWTGWHDGSVKEYDGTDWQ